MDDTNNRDAINGSDAKNVGNTSRRRDVSNNIAIATAGSPGTSTAVRTSEH
jgi:hypothetical protein